MDNYSTTIAVNNNPAELLQQVKNKTQRRYRMAITITTLGRHLLLLSVGTLMVFPFLWMILGSMKTNDEIFNHPLKLLPDRFHLQGFIDAFNAAPFATYLVNSFTVALAITLVTLINSSLFAYAITQLRIRYAGLFFGAVMLCYMMPAAVSYIPSYIILARLGLLDHHLGLVISNAASLFGVFYLRQVFLKIHGSLIEAARIDGASEIKILCAIVLPQCKSALITLGLLTFISHYNNYFWPNLVISSPERDLIATGIRRFFIAEGQYGLNWSQIMAASAITVLPLLILFLFCQKTILSGLSDTGVKE